MEAEVQQTEQQQVEQQALDKLASSQQSAQEHITGQTDEIPEGYNPDGTPQEELIAGKFKSQEDLLQAYQELEKKLGSNNTNDTTVDETPAEPKAEETKAEPKAEETPTDTEAPAFSKFHEEFQANGSLSEDSYSELQKMGLSKNDVDAYIEGQKAIAEKFTSKVFELTGGEDSYNNLVAWASENMDAGTIAEYNEALQKGDSDKVFRLVEYMNLKQGNTAPSEPNRIEGQATNDTGGLKPFASKLEWQQATANKLYGRDPKYTNMVDKRYLSALKKGNI